MHLSCWIITEGMAGTENQCLGIAEALGVTPEVKRVGLRQPWKMLSPHLGMEKPSSFTTPLTAPWPDLVIASGRKAIAACRYIRRESKGKTFIVFVQDPRSHHKIFDLIIVPEHDPARGDNVFVTTASPNRITIEKLENEKQKFPQFEKIRSPRVAVLIGGDSKAHHMSTGIVGDLADDLKKLNAGLMVTTSRRTGPENTAILKNALEGTNNFFWDGTGDNPYFAMLAYADYIIVTSDSVSMLSETATVGKPIFMVPLAGGSKRLDKFHRTLMNEGIIRLFQGKVEKWTYTPLRDAQKAAEEIKKRLKIQP